MDDLQLLLYTKEDDDAISGDYLIPHLDPPTPLLKRIFKKSMMEVLKIICCRNSGQDVG